MNRRDVVIVAVLVNCALLTVLFFTASVQEEASIPLAAEESMPTPASILVPENIATEEAIVKNEEEPIVHVLPSVVEKKETVQKKEEAPIAIAPTFAEKQESKEISKLKEVIVKAGDTLDKIAKIHNSSIKEIVAINQLPNTFLRVGQVLRIPTKAEVAKEEKKQEIAYYIVKSGDNPWTIAMKHHMKVEELLRLNGLDSKSAKRLKPGDKLRIR